MFLKIFAKLNISVILCSYCCLRDNTPHTDLPLLLLWYETLFSVLFQDTFCDANLHRVTEFPKFRNIKDENIGCFLSGGIGVVYVRPRRLMVLGTAREGRYKKSYFWASWATAHCWFHELFASGLRSVNKSSDSHMLRGGEKFIAVNVFYIHDINE